MGAGAGKGEGGGEGGREGKAGGEGGGVVWEKDCKSNRYQIDHLNPAHFFRKVRRPDMP